MKPTITTLIVSAFATALAGAGDYYSGGKAPLPAKAPVIEECLDLGGSIVSGYRTDYIIHGLRTNRDAVWVDVNYQFDSFVPMTFGAYHSSGMNRVFPYGAIGPIDENAVYIKAALGEIAGFRVDLGYTHRFLDFNGFNVIRGSYGDISVDIRRDLGFADLVMGSALGLNSRSGYFASGGGEGWVHYAGLEKSFGLCEYADLVVSTGVGYHDGYYFSTPAGSSDWSHYYLKAAIPVELNCRTTLTPFIGYQGVQQWRVFTRQGDLLHGGVSLNVTF